MKTEIDDILNKFNDDFIHSQQKLDVDFEEILLDNLWELYEYDKIFDNKVNLVYDTSSNSKTNEKST